MNFAKSFTYIFEDPDWFSKLWKPVLIGLIPIVGQLVLQGYMLNVTRNVVRGDQRPLYEMDFGEDLRVGFRMFLVQLVYALPFALLYSILSAFFAQKAISSLEAGYSIAVGGLVGQLLITLLSLLISVVFFFVFPVISANVAVKGTFKAGFEFKELFEMVKSNFAAWLMVLGGSLIAGIIAPSGVILFFVGVIATAAYAGLMVAHLRGQAYRESTHTVQTQQPYYPGY